MIEYESVKDRMIKYASVKFEWLNTQGWYLQIGYIRKCKIQNYLIRKLASETRTPYLHTASFILRDQIILSNRDLCTSYAVLQGGDFCVCHQTNNLSMNLTSMCCYGTCYCRI